MRKRKFGILILIIVLALSVLSGCSTLYKELKVESTEAEKLENEDLEITLEPVEVEPAEITSQEKHIVTSDTTVYYSPGISSFHADRYCEVIADEMMILQGTVEMARKNAINSACEKCIEYIE